jgi:hypothetical protein
VVRTRQRTCPALIPFLFLAYNENHNGSPECDTCRALLENYSRKKSWSRIGRSGPRCSLSKGTERSLQVECFLLNTPHPSPISPHLPYVEARLAHPLPCALQGGGKSLMGRRSWKKRYFVLHFHTLKYYRCPHNNTHPHRPVFPQQRCWAGLGTATTAAPADLLASDHADVCLLALPLQELVLIYIL